MSDLKVVPLIKKDTPIEREEEVVSFFNAVKQEALKSSASKFVVIHLTAEGDEYIHTIDTLNLRTSEAISLLEITKNTLLNSMK